MHTFCFPTGLLSFFGETPLCPNILFSTRCHKTFCVMNPPPLKLLLWSLTFLVTLALSPTNFRPWASVSKTVPPSNLRILSSISPWSLVPILSGLPQFISFRPRERPAKPEQFLQLTIPINSPHHVGFPPSLPLGVEFHFTPTLPWNLQFFLLSYAFHTTGSSCDRTPLSAVCLCLHLPFLSTPIYLSASVKLLPFMPLLPMTMNAGCVQQCCFHIFPLLLRVTCPDQRHAPFHCLP